MKRYRVKFHVTPLRLWRRHFRYEAIAKFYGLINAGVAELLVSEERSEEFGLPSPYPVIELARSA